MSGDTLSRWWQAREARERQVSLAGAVVVALLLGWAFVWHPLSLARASLQTRLATQKQDLAYMQRAAVELRALQARGSHGQARREGKSLLALTDASARDAGLGPALKRVEPLDDKRVRVEFAAAGFDALAAWLQGLQRDYGIRADDVSIDRGAGDGVVDARLTVQEP
jgi:general secretion pathway protein M